jgi:CheY-like chemotaxis protein
MNTISNRHFLVVDDEPFIRAVVTRFLRDSGAASVVEAADGEAAIAAIAGYDLPFSAVVSDVNMLPMNGIALLRAIRTGEAGCKRNTPVLMLTVNAETKPAAEASALGADAFVLKPIHREAFIERLEWILEHKAAAAAP